MIGLVIARSVAGARARMRRSLINRDFALLWGGQVITDLGTVLCTTALVVWVAAVLARGQGWAPLAVSALLVAQALPTLVVRPLAGVLVDRADARTLMARMDAVRGALIAALGVPIVSPLAPGLKLVALLLGVLLVSVATQFFNSALLVLINRLVVEADLPRASGLSEVTWNVASVLGPPLAAPLVLGLGIGWALALNAASFIVSYLTLRAIPPGRTGVPAALDGGNAGRAVLGELRAGLRFVVGNQTVRVVTGTIALAMLGAGTLHALDYFFVTETLQTSPALYGLVAPAFGGGSILGALGAGRLIPRLGAARTFQGSLLGVGVCIVILSRQTVLLPALAIWLLLGVVNAATNVALVPLLLGATPRALVGRMNALFFTAISATSLIASALAGWLVSDVLRGFSASVLGLRFGPVDMLLTLAGLLICLSALVAMAGLQGQE